MLLLTKHSIITIPHSTLSKMCNGTDTLAMESISNSFIFISIRLDFENLFPIVR